MDTKIIRNTNLEHFEVLSLSGQLVASEPASSLVAQGLNDTNLNTLNTFNTLSTQTPRGQELLGHIRKYWQIKMMACCSSLLNFMRNPKLAHILDLSFSYRRAEKYAIMYLNSTMDRFRTVGLTPCSLWTAPFRNAGFKNE